MREYLSQVIDNKGTTTINVEHSTPVLVGSSESGKIDMDDILNFQVDDYRNSLGALIHEIWEQFEIQINKTKSEDAHKNALGIEGECCGFKTDTSDKTGNLINNLNYIDNENNMIIMRYKPLDGKDKYIRRAISFDENGNIIKPQRKK